MGRLASVGTKRETAISVCGGESKRVEGFSCKENGEGDRQDSGRQFQDCRKKNGKHGGEKKRCAYGIPGVHEEERRKRKKGSQSRHLLDEGKKTTKSR